MQKSTVDEIRQRFDQDVDRFSNLETGQSAAVDAPLALELVTQAAIAATPAPTHILDIGCGAGNFSLRLLQAAPSITNVILVDLSRPMLDRAVERIHDSFPDVRVISHQTDMRNIQLPENEFDIVVAAAVLHHLRSDAEWDSVFCNILQSLSSKGSFWVFDLMQQTTPAVHQVLWQRYADYLATFKGEEYRNQVFAYIEEEDSPRPLFEQLARLHSTGFSKIEVLHYNSCFGAYGGIR